MGTPILGYWNLRGRISSVRALLYYSRVKFEDKRYTMENANDWFGRDKLNGLGLDFPNLPYYIDGDVKLTHVSLFINFSFYNPFKKNSGKVKSYVTHGKLC